LSQLEEISDRKARLDIINGKKKITIRKDWRDYRPGLVIICCHIEPWAVMAEITKVRHCTLEEVTEAEYQADGFKSKKGLLEGLRKFYPDITWNSPVTIIRWDNAHGYWVDNRDKYRQYASEKQADG